MATPIAALIYRGEGDDELRTLWQAVGQLRDRGFSIKGLLNKTDAQGGKMRDRVCSLTDSREYAIMYDGGCTEDTCKLRPRGWRLLPKSSAKRCKARPIFWYSTNSAMPRAKAAG